MISKLFVKKILFLKKLVFPEWIGPTCSPWKTFCERMFCSRYEKQGRNLLSPWRLWAPFVWPLRELGIKIDIWENPGVTLRLNWSSPYGAMRFDRIWVSLGSLLSLFRMHQSGCSEIYCDASRELSHLGLSPVPLCVSIKKKVCVTAQQSVHASKLSPTLPSSFFLL